MLCHIKYRFNVICFRFFFFHVSETVLISNHVPQGIFYGPLKLTLFIEEAQMYLCFNKRWRLVSSVSNHQFFRLRRKNAIEMVLIGPVLVSNKNSFPKIILMLQVKYFMSKTSKIYEILDQEKQKKLKTKPTK